MGNRSDGSGELITERANLLQVRRYIQSYTDIFKDYEKNIRSFIENSTQIILPRLEKSGYYKQNQYTVTNFDELREALFEYSQENDLTDLKQQIAEINDLVSECTLRKIYGKDAIINATDIENIYDLKKTIDDRITQIDAVLQSSANQPNIKASKKQDAA